MEDAKKVLVVSGHPQLDDDSVANKAIVEELSKLEGVVIDRLDSPYPDYRIDVAAEQAKLVADLIAKL